MSPTTESDILVVGAGLAGLACARRLHAAGRTVLVCEATSSVGGRVQTDEVDGFLLDRGFQVLLTGYPAVRAQLDLEALDLRAFASGVRIQRGGRSHTLVDPFRDPRGGLKALQALRAPVTGVGDGLRLLALRRRVLRTEGAVLATTSQVSSNQRLADLGFSPLTVAAFLRPFLAGVFLDPELTTSSRLTELVLRSFFLGEVAVPGGGMGRIPAQLAAGLPPGTVRVRTPVAGLADDGVVLADGQRLRARTVVVATDGPTAGELFGSDVLPAPAGRGTVTVYHRAATPPVEGPWLVLDGDGTGPVNNLAVLSEVAPTYAPPGNALVASSIVGVPRVDDAELDRQVRRQLRGWFGDQVDAWSRLATYRIPFAQPRQEPKDLPNLQRPVQLGPGRFVCGDHRDTGSIQGALVSGRRTADAILAEPASGSSAAARRAG